MKTKIIIVSLFFVLTCQIVHAFVFPLVPVVVASYMAANPISYYVVGSTVLHAAAGIGALAYWGYKSYASGSIETTPSDVKRKSEYTWVDLTLLKEPVVKKKDVTARVPLSTLVVAAVASTNKPKLKALATEFINVDFNGVSNANVTVGDAIMLGTTPARVVSVVTSGSTGCQAPAPPRRSFSGDLVSYSVDAPPPPGTCPIGDVGRVSTFYYLTVGQPKQSGIKQFSATQASAVINENPDYYSGEIDDFLKDAPNVFHDESFPEPIPQAVADASAAKAAAAVASRAADAELLNTTTAVAGSARSAATAARGAANSDPTNVGLGQEATRLEGLADKADGILAGVKSSQASSVLGSADGSAKTAEEVAAAESALAGIPSNSYDTTIEAPEKKDIGSLLTTFAGSSPIVSMLGSFTLTTSNSSGVLSIGNIYGKDLTFDFTRWESILNICGGILLVIMHGFAAFIVVRGW